MFSTTRYQLPWCFAADQCLSRGPQGGKTRRDGLCSDWEEKPLSATCWQFVCGQGEVAAGLTPKYCFWVINKKDFKSLVIQNKFIGQFLALLLTLTKKEFLIG